MRDFLDLARFIRGTGRVTRRTDGSHFVPSDVDERNVDELLPAVGDLPHASTSTTGSARAQWTQAKLLMLINDNEWTTEECTHL